MVRLSRRTERIQTHPANGNVQDSGGMPVHRQTIPETPGMCAGSPLPLPDADEHSYRDILYVGGTCVKWIPPFIELVSRREPMYISHSYCLLFYSRAREFPDDAEQPFNTPALLAQVD